MGEEWGWLVQNLTKHCCILIYVSYVRMIKLMLFFLDIKILSWSAKYPFLYNIWINVFLYNICETQEPIQVSTFTRISSPQCARKALDCVWYADERCILISISCDAWRDVRTARNQFDVNVFVKRQSHNVNISYFYANHVRVVSWKMKMVLAFSVWKRDKPNIKLTFGCYELIYNRGRTAKIFDLIIDSFF